MRSNAFLGSIATSILAGLVLFGAAGCNGGASQKTDGGNTSTTSTTTGTGTSSRKMPAGKGNTQSGDTIKIGLVASQTGDLRPWGLDCELGAKLAVQEINAAGGINGKQVELMIQDSQSAAEKGKTAAEKLMSDGALVLVGEVASGITAQMAQSAFDKGVPVVAVGATRTDLTDIGAHVFRVCYIDDFQGPVMAKFAFEELGLKKVAIMTDQKQPYSTGLSESFRKKFTELGGEIVDEQKYDSGQSQFSSQLTAIKAKSPDGLFLSGYFNEVGPIIRAADGMGLKVPYLGGDGWDSREIFQNAGPAIANGYFCNHYNNDEDRPEVKDFLKNWVAAYQSPPATTMGALGYDAVKLTADAIKRAKSMDSMAIMEALEATENFPSVSGMITLKGNNGNPPKRALVVGMDPARQAQVFKKAYEATDLK